MAKALKATPTTQGCCRREIQRSAYVTSTLRADILLTTPSKTSRRLAASLLSGNSQGHLKGRNGRFTVGRGRLPTYLFASCNAGCFQPLPSIINIPQRTQCHEHAPSAASMYGCRRHRQNVDLAYIACHRLIDDVGPLQNSDVW